MIYDLFPFAFKNSISEPRIAVFLRDHIKDSDNDR